MQNDIIKPPQADGQPVSQPQPQQQRPAGSAQVPPAASERPLPIPDLASVSPTSKKRSTPKAAVFAAVIVCLLLIGASIYLSALQTKELDEVAKKAQSTQTQDEAKATPDIDGALSEIDKLPDPNDDPAAELTDQALGL